DSAVVVDGEGRIVLVNTQTEGMFQYSRDELVGRPVEILLPERFHEAHRRHRGDYLREPRTRPMGIGLDLSGRRRDGSEFPVDISLGAIQTDEGRLVTAFVRDMTERKAEAELQQQLAERRSMISHIVRAGEAERQRIASDLH